MGDFACATCGVEFNAGDTHHCSAVRILPAGMGSSPAPLMPITFAPSMTPGLTLQQRAEVARMIEEAIGAALLRLATQLEETPIADEADPIL